MHVKLIDDGRIKKITSDDLLAIPEKFQILPPIVMDVYLTNIEPYDSDQSWDDTITRAIESIVKSSNHDVIRYLIGDIELAFANTLILNNVKMYKESFERGLELIPHIITKNYGVRTEKPLKKLIELLENYRKSEPNFLDGIDGGGTPKIASINKKIAEGNSECIMSKEINKSVTWNDLPERFADELSIDSNISDNAENKTFENKDSRESEESSNFENIEITADNSKLYDNEDIPNIENIKIADNNTKSYNSKVNDYEHIPPSEIDDDNKSLTSEYITSDDDNAFQLVEELLKKFQATKNVSNTPTTDITVIPKKRKPAEVVKTVSGTPKHSLTKVFKELETIWAETESTIILRFSASDVLDYIIDLNENTLFIQ